MSKVYQKYCQIFPTGYKMLPNVMLLAYLPWSLHPSGKKGGGCGFSFWLWKCRGIFNNLSWLCRSILGCSTSASSSCVPSSLVACRDVNYANPQYRLRKTGSIFDSIQKINKMIQRCYKLCQKWRNYNSWHSDYIQAVGNQVSDSIWIV